MMKILNKILFWLNCARVYSLPITVLNWFVIFVYTLKHNSNVILGILALAGISLVHMATNLIDDYFDYKILIKDENFLNSAQNCKCLYLKNKQATVDELKYAIITFLALAGIIGSVLFFLSGYYVAVLALAGLGIAISYQKFSICGIGELAVFLAYGPLLYEGTYYVMTGKFSIYVLILSIACVLVTITILYTHMLMDYDGDECSHKKTLCRFMKTKEVALNFLLVFYLGGFAGMAFFAVLTKNYFYLLTFLTVPMICELYKTLKIFNEDKTNLPDVKFWHYPLDNWEKIRTSPDAPFYFRFFYSRNILTWFLLLTCLATMCD